MHTFEAAVFIIAILGVIALILWRRSSAVAASPLRSKSNAQEPPVGALAESSAKRPSKMTIGPSPSAAVFTLERCEQPSDYEMTTEMPIDGGLVPMLSPVFQAAPALLTTAEMAGKHLMRVEVNGELVRAANGDGFRAFTMAGGRIKEHAKLFEVQNLKALVNAAAAWQLVSIIVAQKHLADISRKLDVIKKQVGEISIFLDSERRSQLIGAQDYFQQIHQSLLAGEFRDEVLHQIEAHEVNLLKVQAHLFDELGKAIKSDIVHAETFGTERLTSDLHSKIAKNESIAKDLALCLKVRVIGLYLRSLFPEASPILLRDRQASISASVQRFTSLSGDFSETLEKQIAGVDSFWNAKETLEMRRSQLSDRKNAVIHLINHEAKKSKDILDSGQELLRELAKKYHFYVEIQNGLVIGARQPKQPGSVSS